MPNHIDTGISIKLNEWLSDPLSIVSQIALQVIFFYIKFHFLPEEESSGLSKTVGMVSC